ncbi:hypothetical protein CLOM_g13195 [Closterium sp. NIES-68]|nr:hypothetical protein CLOM_g13195 [Closterium sp. NIES-68]GJP76138.1 hypothetical protein CLOP_g6513 [Closterium sp. NIES-67]
MLATTPPTLSSAGSLRRESRMPLQFNSPMSACISIGGADFGATTSATTSASSRSSSHCSSSRCGNTGTGSSSSSSDSGSGGLRAVAARAAAAAVRVVGRLRPRYAGSNCSSSSPSRNSTRTSGNCGISAFEPAAEAADAVKFAGPVAEAAAEAAEAAADVECDDEPAIMVFLDDGTMRIYSMPSLPLPGVRPDAASNSFESSSDDADDAESSSPRDSSSCDSGDSGDSSSCNSTGGAENAAESWCRGNPPASSDQNRSPSDHSRSLGGEQSPLTQLSQLSKEAMPPLVTPLLAADVLADFPGHRLCCSSPSRAQSPLEPSAVLRPGGTYYLLGEKTRRVWEGRGGSWGYAKEGRGVGMDGEGFKLREGSSGFYSPVSATAYCRCPICLAEEDAAARHTAAV